MSICVILSKKICQDVKFARKLLLEPIDRLKIEKNEVLIFSKSGIFNLYGRIGEFFFRSIIIFNVYQTTPKVYWDILSYFKA